MANKNSGYKKIIKRWICYNLYLTLSITLVFYVCLSSSAYSFEELEQHVIVDEIEIIGLWRTKPKVVMRELLFRKGDILTTKKLLASIQRLKNLRIFSKVNAQLTLKPDSNVKLTLKIQEKWTTIPYFSISGGGGTTYAYAGIYDINTFGRLIETGVQYDNWNGKPGGWLWMRDPRFLDKRLLFGFDLLKTKRSRQLYAKNSKNQGDFVIDTALLNFILKQEITRTFQIGGELKINKSRIIESTTNSFIDQNTLNLLSSNNKNTRTFATVFVELGKLDFDNYLVKGKFSKLSIEHSNRSLGSTKAITKINWRNRIFWRLPYDANIGFRLNTGWTNTNEIQDLYYIGGFQNIRGYLDGQFRSKTYWQFNGEYRIPSFKSNWLVLQHILFVDTVSTGSSIRQLKNNSIQFSSAGIGIRIISPRIYSFNGRIDIALFTSGNSPSSISFGSQQYF